MAQVADIRIEYHSEEAIAEMKEKVEAWLLACGEDAAAVAAEFCPVDTGRLKNSISAATTNMQSSVNDYGGDYAKPEEYAVQATPEEGAVYIGTNVEYAPYQEFGTSKGIPGKHFLQFGVSAHPKEYQALLEQYLKS